MNTVEWDSHKSTKCATCKYKRRCVIKKYMQANPEDEWARNIFRLGSCSQWAKEPEKPKKPTKRRQ